jgi:hypothetical protein
VRRLFHDFRQRFLSVKRARGPRYALVHQRAAEIVGACLQARCDAVAAHLYPRGLNVLHDRMQRQAGAADAPFNRLRCRDLLHAGREEYRYGFAALNLGLDRYPAHARRAR